MRFVAEFLASLVGALVLTTLAEYVVHRLMHWGFLYGRGHRSHHLGNDARTFVHDLLDYGIPAVLLCWPVLFVSLSAGLGWMVGVLGYAVLAAYSHQLQHANANLVFWMQSAVHRLHHDQDMGAHNFGVLVDWWDRLFNTYQPAVGAYTHKTRSWRAYFAIPWR